MRTMETSSGRKASLKSEFKFCALQKMFRFI
jgi:hypothetical protein